MTVTAVPAFGQVPNIGVAILTTAKVTALSGATNTVLGFTPGSNGSIVNGIAAMPRATIGTAATIAVYASSDSGTTLNLIAVGVLAAWTFAGTTAPVPLNLNNLNGAAISVSNPLYVPNGTTLYASTGLTGDIIVAFNAVNL